MRMVLLALALLLAGCVAPLPPSSTAPLPGSAAARLSGDLAERNFVAVVARMAPVMRTTCEERLPPQRCDFQIFVDERPGLPVNALQTLDRAGNPVIVFTRSLIDDARNQDELAFVLGHEAAHHIAGHIPRQQAGAMAGALVFGTLAQLSGGATAQSVDQAARLGAMLGARVYSREHELEADALGAVIAHRAGFDPVNGTRFFERIPDPGNQFLGTHPPHAERIAVVRRTMDQLRGS
ncbi:MAG: M48 family metalloprotease [Rhodobacteraceae bacterium]|nr:M48 family metalloprotease [Paracoccaceae bacterium]